MGLSKIPETGDPITVRAFYGTPLTEGRGWMGAVVTGIVRGRVRFEVTDLVPVSVETADGKREPRSSTCDYLVKAADPSIRDWTPRLHFSMDQELDFYQGVRAIRQRAKLFGGKAFESLDEDQVDFVMSTTYAFEHPDVIDVAKRTLPALDPVGQMLAEGKL